MPTIEISDELYKRIMDGAEGASVEKFLDRAILASTGGAGLIYKIGKGKDKRWHWLLVDSGNNELAGSTKPFNSRVECDAAVTRLRHSLTASVIYPAGTV